MPADELDFDTLREDNNRYFSTLTRYREMRVSLIFRSALAAIVLIFASFPISSLVPDVSYWLFAPSTPIPLGNLRAPEFDPESLKKLKTNDYVSFENDVIQYNEIRSSDSKYVFYYSPLTHCVVRTAQIIPQKTAAEVSYLSAREVQWIIEGKVLPEDFSVGLTGSGRLMTAKDAPDWARSAIEFMANSSGDSQDSMFFLLEGDTPSSYGGFAALFAGAMLLVLMTLLLWGRAFMKFLKLKKEFESIRNKEMNLNA